MEPKNDLKEPETVAEDLNADSTASVDDFIKELEAKEKDLQITADYEIEVEDTDEEPVPDFVLQELAKHDGTVSSPSPGAGPSGGSRPDRRVQELEEEVEKLEARIKELRTERNEIQEKSDRRLKDFENFKYRVDRERRGAFIEQIATLASQMLPVIDNLDRALDSAHAVPDERRKEIKQFFEGLELVHRQINAVLGGMGVEPIKTVGDRFDPNFHEAVAVEEHNDAAANTILEEMLRGYRIGNRVIRHSMVKVTTSPAGARNEAQKAETEHEADAPVISEPVDAQPEGENTEEAE